MNPSTLRDRLRDVIQASVPASRPRSADEASAIAPAIKAESFSVSAHSAERVLGGEWRHSAAGRSFVIVRRYAAETPYGGHRVGDFFERLERAGGSARLFGAATARAPFVFFDLETTGLNGGAGTHAFLVGCARFEADGALVTEQHLMIDYASERAMLRVVANDLEHAGTLVTFNGKSFDAPVIETRYLFHRADSPCTRLPHLDVLHPARRFWGAASEAGCSLGTLEAQILGVRRVGDVPGLEIPARYFQFIRSGDPRPLAPVLEHNRLDLVSLAGLTARLLALAEDGPEAARDAHEALALGRTYERAGLPWRAEQAFERAAVTCGLVSSLRIVKAEALRALALEARRSRRYDVAAERWRQVFEIPGCPHSLSREASEALAIHHEHRLRDLEAAKGFALKSLELERGAAWGDAVRHRLARIERKMVSERRSSFPSSPPSPPACGSPTSGHRTSS